MQIGIMRLFPSRFLKMRQRQSSSQYKQWLKNSEDVSSDEDIRQAFKTEEVLSKLDSSLDDFANTQMDISNYQQIVKHKYEALDFLEPSQVMEIIEKFKRKHPDIALV